MFIEQLESTTNIPKSKLLSLSKTASKRYKVYSIQKRTGGKRLIEHPSRELKAIQRWIVQVLISRFPVHESATAYRKGVGIRENAARHQYTNFTNRYDFSNFFPSFSKDRVITFVSERSAALGIELDQVDLDFIGNIVCRNGKLTIGAPSSPAITNAMMFEFDQRMHNYCREKGIIYSRYADDIFISSTRSGQLRNLERLIVQSKRGITHIKLRLNHKKTSHLSRKFNRTIAGVVITPQRKLSIGRHRKREIKSLIFEMKKGGLDLERISYLRGLFAFAIDIEPDFEERLIEKYGKELIGILRTGGAKYQRTIDLS